MKQLKDIVNVETIRKYQFLLEQNIRSIKLNGLNDDYYKDEQLELFIEWKRINDTFKENKKMHTTPEGERQLKRWLYKKLV